MKLRQRLVTVFAVLAVGGGLAVVSESPAQASFSDCNSGTVCIWNAVNGSGLPIGGGFSSTPGTCFDLFGAQNDSADSFRNRTTKSIQFYDNHGCTGQLLKSEDGRTMFDGVTQANFMQVDTVASHPGCQFPSTCNRNRASSVFFNNNFAQPLLTQQLEVVGARAVIPGCQNIGMDDSVPPFPASVTWQPAENGHHYGSYRISSGCGHQLTARLRGIGPDSSGREAIVFLHVQRDDGSWYRTSTVHFRTGQGAVKVASMLPENHRFYLHCADAIADPLENQPCRLTFQF